MREDHKTALPRMHVLLCVNDRRGTSDPLPSCAAHVSRAEVKSLKAWLQEEGLSPAVQITATYCLGRCHAEGAAAAVYPPGAFFTHVRSAADVREFIRERAKRAGLC